MGGVPRRRTRRVRVFLVLRPLPGLGGPAEADHAPDPYRRREAVCRLCRPHWRDRRWPYWRDHPGTDLRRCPGCIELHIRRGGMEPEAAGLDRGTCPRLRLFRRRPPPDGPRLCSREHNRGFVPSSVMWRVRGKHLISLTDLGGGGTSRESSRKRTLYSLLPEWRLPCWNASSSSRRRSTGSWAAGSGLGSSFM